MNVWVILLIILIIVLSVFAVIYTIKAFYNKVSTGEEGLIGRQGIAESSINREKGKIFINGEHWNAISTKNIAKGKKVIVLKVLENLILRVKEV
ncbi:NfeD family protein [bacterium]|nr:NfeD family protein [bacterium]